MITLDDYNNLAFSKIEDAFLFNKLLKRAEIVIENMTNHYITQHNIDEINSFILEKYKHALILQIEYFNMLESVSSTEINNSPNTITIGRTTISRGYKGRQLDNSNGNPLINPDVYTVLEGTGLLFRGGYT